MHLCLDINEWIRICGYAGWLKRVSHRNISFDGVLINACAIKVKDLFLFMYRPVRTNVS